MRGKGTLFLLFGALFASIFSVFASGNWQQLITMRETLSVQQQRNDELREYVSGLKREVVGLQRDDRALEKAARNNLGMARPDEVVVIFDK